MIFLIGFNFIAVCILMSFFSNRHPWNYLFMLLFTISIAVLVGVSCTQRKGKLFYFLCFLNCYSFWIHPCSVFLAISRKHEILRILFLLFTMFLPTGEAVLLAAGLTLLITIALTMFTFVAAKRGMDFSFLGPFLLCAVLLLIAFGLIRVSHSSDFKSQSRKTYHVM